MDRPPPHPNIGPRPEIRSLTGARFVAAILVVACHFLHLRGDSPVTAWMKGVIALGYLGVPFFLILSGFILTYNYIAIGTETRARDLNVRQFWTARFARIYPTYFLALFLHAPFFFLSFRYVQNPHAIWFNRCVIGAATLLLLQSLFPPEIFQSWNEVGWTVSAEAAFYLLFPWTNRRVGMLRPKAAVRLLLILALALCLIDLMIIPSLPAHGSFLGLHDRFVWSRFPLFLWPLFLIGSVLCPLFIFLRNRKAVATRAGIACTVLAISIIVCMGLEGARWPLPGPATDVSYAALLSAMIFAMAFDRGPICQLLGSPPMHLLGESSYALYVLQGPLNILLTRAWRLVSRFGSSPSEIPPMLLILGLVAASVLVHLFFEQPARRILRRWMSPRATT